jgi:hypothetical protein
MFVRNREVGCRPLAILVAVISLGFLLIIDTEVFFSCCHVILVEQKAFALRSASRLGRVADG